MPRELTMPKLSDSMEDAVIVRWLKDAGQSFARGEPLAEIETDKATVVYEAETDGVIASIVVPEGNAARVGEPIATLDGAGASAPAPVSASAPASESGSAPTPAPERGRDESPRRRSGAAGGANDAAPGRARATPVARRRAVELGISLHGLGGTGPGGRITRTDVERAAASTAAAPEPPGDDSSLARSGGEESAKGTAESLPLTPTQATIARRMTAGAAVPTFTVTVEIDMSTVTQMRAGAGELVDPVPSVNDFVVRAAALTLRRFPALNASFAGDRIERWSRVNVGIAVALDGALLVPAVRDADRRTLAEIASESRLLVERARSRGLGPDDLTSATFTVSNLGMFGVHSFTAIVDPPQTAILAVGGIARRPVEGGDGRVEFRDTMLATLTADHRVVYGADGAAFLAHLRKLLESPLSLVV
jgi:pyruvate dehydrogenase E2 component (dihydrolipoamide acetyltransferase)